MRIHSTTILAMPGIAIRRPFWRRLLRVLPVLSITTLSMSVMTLTGAAARAEDAGAGDNAGQPVAGYHKGFLIRDPEGPFELRIGARVQTRFVYEALDGADDETAFSIPRARLTLAGKVLTDRLHYKMQVDFGKGFVTLKDFYTDYALAGGGGPQLRVGQTKRPFSRQQLASSAQLEFVDRAITDKAFDAGRDIGVMLHNGFERSPALEYALGIFNGSGDKTHFSGDVTVDASGETGAVEDGKFSNIPGRLHPVIVARLGHNYGGIKGISEADLEGGGLRYAVAWSGLADLDADDNDDGAIRTQVDGVVKYRGFAATAALYAAWSQSGTAFTDQRYSGTGLHVQAGTMLTDHVQPAVRYARLLPEGRDNDEQELLAGMSVYLFEHQIKWQSEIGALLTQRAGGSDTSDFVIRTQMQVAF